jgi:hypothetical protein
MEAQNAQNIPTKHPKGPKNSQKEKKLSSKETKRPNSNFAKRPKQASKIAQQFQVDKLIDLAAPPPKGTGVQVKISETFRSVTRETLPKGKAKYS